MNDGTVDSNVAMASVHIAPLNAPSFALSTKAVTVDQGVGSQVLTGFVQDISADLTSDSNQLLHFVVTNNNNALFTRQPQIDDQGNLSYTLASNAHGLATVEVVLMDSWGITNDGFNASSTQTFTIHAHSPNASIAQTVSERAMGILTVPVFETTQGVEFALSKDDSSLFNLRPYIDGNGNLSYNLAPNQFNEAGASLHLLDVVQLQGAALDVGNKDRSLMESGFVTHVTPITQEHLFSASLRESSALIEYTRRDAGVQFSHERPFAGLEQATFMPVFANYDGFLYRRRLKPKPTSEQILFKQLIDGVWLARMNSNELLDVADQAHECYQFRSEEDLNVEATIYFMALHAECVELLGNLMVRACVQSTVLSTEDLDQVLERRTNITVEQ